MKTKQDIINAISDVEHPAIAYSLIDLGIVKDITLEDNKARVTFAFPFANIPIAEQLVNSIYDRVYHLGLDFEYAIVQMNEAEKQKFMKMETDGWKQKS